jgi:ADP-ribose pyrophosphatase
MVAHLRPSGRVLLVRQYRPPCDAPVIEFPAGLIDDGEEPADTAVRELREETGYTGTVRWISAPCPNSPGLSDEWARLAVMEVDETTDANRDPCQQCDEGEHIEVLRIPWSQAAAFLHQAVRDGNLVDGKVLCCFLHQLPGQTDEADVAAEPVTIHR